MKANFYTVTARGKRVYFVTYEDAKKWRDTHPNYPKEIHHIYPIERTGSAPSTGRKAFGEWGGKRK